MDNTGSKRELIEAMLAAIDGNDWDALSKLFTHDTTYDVSGFTPMSGREAVMNYYAYDRPIQSGTHEIETVIEQDDRAVCCGTFKGRRKDGVAVEAAFADLVEFRDSRIARRRVYLCQPAVEASGL